MRKKLAIIFLLIVFSFTTSAPGTSTNLESTGDELTLRPRPPIYIDGNNNFTAANGVSNPEATGTESDPYIIENWNIDASSADGIEVKNTDVFFIIRNCKIHSGMIQAHEGIEFRNITNSRIENTTLENNDFGISIHCSSNIHIYNCSAYDGRVGVGLVHSSNNVVISCKFHNNNYGISLFSSSNNSITNSTIYSNSEVGVRLEFAANNNTVRECAIYDNLYGIWQKASSNNHIHNSSIYSNSNYGVYNYNTDPSYIVDATNNWWGHESGPSGTAPGAGDAITSNVIYEPWLTIKEEKNAEGLRALLFLGLLLAALLSIVLIVLISYKYLKRRF